MEKQNKLKIALKELQSELDKLVLDEDFLGAAKYKELLQFLGHIQSERHSAALQKLNIPISYEMGARETLFLEVSCNESVESFLNKLNCISTEISRDYFLLSESFSKHIQLDILGFEFSSNVFALQLCGLCQLILWEEKDGLQVRLLGTTSHLTALFASLRYLECLFESWKCTKSHLNLFWPQFEDDLSIDWLTRSIQDTLGVVEQTKQAFVYQFTFKNNPFILDDLHAFLRDTVLMRDALRGLVLNEHFDTYSRQLSSAMGILQYHHSVEMSDLLYWFRLRDFAGNHGTNPFYDCWKFSEILQPKVASNSASVGQARAQILQSTLRN